MKRLKGVAGGQRPSPEVSLVRPDTKPDPDFECRNPEFSDYYRVTSYSDMQESLNRTWQYIDDMGATLGYISIAAAHLRPGRDPALQGMGYGNIPALLVGYLATDKDHERRGWLPTFYCGRSKRRCACQRGLGAASSCLTPSTIPTS